MERWLEGKGAAAERTLRVLEDIRASGNFDLATLPVALREVRDLL